MNDRIAIDLVDGGHSIPSRRRRSGVKRHFVNAMRDDRKSDAGVQAVKADYPSETVEVVFDPTALRPEEICAAIIEKGYRCVLPDEVEAKRSTVHKLGVLLFGLIGIALISFADTEWMSQSGAPDVSRRLSLGLIFALGLLTACHCIGMCGGFVLSYTADDARLGKRSYLSHVFYGAGKTRSYTAIGAMFGLLGAIVTFSPCCAEPPA